MLKKISFFLALIVIISGFILPFQNAIAAPNGIKLIINGKTVMWYNGPPISINIDGNIVTSDVPPVIINDRTMVPVRVISESLGALVDWDNNTNTVYISYEGNLIELSVGKSEAKVNRNAIKLDTSAMIVNDRTMVPLRFVAEALKLQVDWDQATYTVMIKKPKPEILYSTIKDIQFYGSDNGYQVSIIADGTISQNNFLMQNPDRLVIDVPDSIMGLPNGVIPVGTGLVRQIRVSQFKENPYISRIVIDLEAVQEYKIVQSNDKKIINILFGSQTVEKVKYDEEKDAVIIDTNGAYYNAFKLRDPYRIVLDIPNALLKNPKGDNIIKAEDGNIKSIRWSQFDQNTVRVVVDLSDKMDYKVEKTDDRLYFYLMPYDPNKKHMVVVDPGHGGTDPGASSRDGLKEKDVNLDISLKLNNLLQDAGYDTYMTRVDDSYPELMDRVSLANEVGAEIFVSIHNNAHDNPAVDGTEVLYFPNGYNGDMRDNRTLAKFIHDSIIEEVGTTDRGIIQRSNLVVLKYTEMPSVIVEVAFLTNSDDVKKLKDEDFKWQVAKAIFDGIENYFYYID
ncbi:MAG: N-acetylmuramoyl-L-alanine amidase [Thermoanaerobacteraceae bacterium]|nr:N-acetylmuramoyl-L-alanine amidase [Thermoanaerobacteraceae bacterium]